MTLIRAAVSPIINASRLIPSRYNEPAILGSVTSGITDLEKANRLDAATNPHYTTPVPGLIPEDSSIPHAHVINGPFTHGSANARFSTRTFHAWHSSGDLRTAQIEVAYHRLFEYSDLNSDGFWPQTVKYTQYYASYVAPLHELTVGDPKVNEILNPDSYVASQRFRSTLELERSLGVVYPSVRNPSGVNHAIFHPHTVQNVHMGEHFDLTVNGLTVKDLVWEKN